MSSIFNCKYWNLKHTNLSTSTINPEARILQFMGHCLLASTVYLQPISNNKNINYEKGLGFKLPLKEYRNYVSGNSMLLIFVFYIPLSYHSVIVKQALYLFFHCFLLKIKVNELFYSHHTIYAFHSYIWSFLLVSAIFVIISCFK